LGFSPQWLHAGTGFGSKPEKTSFLNSLFIKSPAGGSRGLKLQTEHLFQKDDSAPHLGMERFVNQKTKPARRNCSILSLIQMTSECRT
jgi:hypothetical protein